MPAQSMKELLKKISEGRVKLSPDYTKSIVGVTSAQA